MRCRDCAGEAALNAESIIGATIEEITLFDMEGEEGMAFWFTDGRFVWVPTTDDRILICETPRYRAN